MTRWLAPVGMALSFTSLVGLGGCDPSTDTKRPPVQLHIGFDRSDSAKAELADFVLAGCRLASRMDPDRDQLTLYRVERVTEPFYNNKPPASQERLQEIILPELKNPPRADQTLPALFLQQVAQAAESVSAQVLIGFYWDGGNDDLSAAGQRNYRAAIHRLAANSKVVGVGLYGIRRENWLSVQAAFAPLKSRLEMHGPRDMDPDTLIEAMNQRLASQNQPPRL